MVYINFFNISTSFFFLILIFFFFSFYIFSTYTNFLKKNSFKSFNFYFIPFIFLAHLSLIFICFTSNFVFIYLSIELFSIIIYYIISVESIDFKKNFYLTKVFNTDISLRYFIISLFGSINILIGISFIFFFFGSFDIKIISTYFIVNTEGVEFFSGNYPNFGFIFFVIGFCIKFGIAPYHFWINGVYDRFKNYFFQYMSIFPKSILLCFFINFFSEFSLCYPSNETIFSLSFFFNALGIINILFGTLSAYGQTDLKRLIMYSSLTNIGYIFICISANVENSLFISYSYIVHYTLALFVLFRIVNEIESTTNKNFFQWNFSEFSIIPFKYKFFLTFIFFNLAGLPPFPLFFNKFFIFSYLWINKFFFSFIFMSVFSIIGYAYYFNFIKFVWFNEKFSYISIFFKFSFFEKNTFKKIFFSSFADITKYCLWSLREGKFENIYWNAENNFDEKIMFFKHKGYKKFSFFDYAYISTNYNNFFFKKFESFISNFEKTITRIFFYSFFMSFFFINYIIIFFKKILSSFILIKYYYSKKAIFFFFMFWNNFFFSSFNWKIKKKIYFMWQNNIFAKTRFFKFENSDFFYKNNIKKAANSIFKNEKINSYLTFFYDKLYNVFQISKNNNLFISPITNVYSTYKIEFYESSFILFKLFICIIIFFIFFFIKFVSNFKYGPSAIVLFSNFIKRIFICTIYFFGTVIFSIFIFIGSFFNFSKNKDFNQFASWIEYNIVIASLVIWTTWIYFFIIDFGSFIYFFRYILIIFFYFAIIFSYPKKNNWFNFKAYSIKNILQFFITISIRLKYEIYSVYNERKNFFWKKI